MGVEGTKEERDLLTHVRTYFLNYGDSRFQSEQGPGDRVIQKRVDFWRLDTEENREYIVPCEAFVAELCVGMHPRAAARLLLKHGWLIGKPGRSTRTVRISGLGPVRAYIFAARVFGDE